MTLSLGSGRTSTLVLCSERLSQSFQCFSVSVALQTRLDKVLTLSCVGGAIVLHPEEAQALVCCMQARPAFQKTYPPKWKDTPDLEWLSDV